jgi:lipoprotein-anchoring transpeptidase ErfK/SrfK
MRAILIVIVLVGLAAAGWWWLHSSPAKATVAAAGFSEMPNPPPAPPPPVPVAVKADYDQAEALWNQLATGGGNPATNAKAPQLSLLYSKVLIGLYNQPGQKVLEKRLVETRLTPLGDELFFAKTPFPDDESGLIGVHQVQAGDNPEHIGRKYGMCREMVNRLRGREPTDNRLDIGESLKVVKVKEKGGNFLHISKSNYVLDLFIGGAFARRYPISHGARETPTPIGRTRLIGRELNPNWTDPKTHKVHGPDDPDNILGKVWMAFSPDGIGQNGLGIHGYTGPNPKSQAMVSNGCIRLSTDQAQELLFCIAPVERDPPVPTTVEIVE